MTLVARITFLVLVGATFAAFFVAQRLKSAPPVIDVNRLARYFSPNGDGSKDVNNFTVVLKVADDVTVDVVTLDGDPVKRLADVVPVRAYRPLPLVWDGTTDEGGRAPDGQYRLRVTLRDEGRSATVQTTMNVDTRAPRSEVCIGYRCNDRLKRMGNIVSQGDRDIRIYIKGVSPRRPTVFRVLRTDDGKPREVTRFRLEKGRHLKRWDGIVDGKPLPPGTYIVQSEVRDTAGNVGVTPAKLELGTVDGRPGLTVRGLAARPPLRPVTAGQRAEFQVDARGAPYRWRVRRVGDSAVRDRGTETEPVLGFRAPEGASGVYLLELRSGRWHTTVPFLVQAERRSTVLVVVPVISWLGNDKLDDPPFDGLPNTLTNGGTVRWPRPFVGTDGLPAGFADEVAPLLVFLDRHRIRYDLTSDLDLDLTRNPRASDRQGVLLAGSQRWVTTTLARRLRRYVSDGGKLATFGADTLRRGVRLRVRESEEAGTLLRATQPAAVDPFGTRIARIRTTPAPVEISQYDGEAPEYGLMEGALSLSGFTRLEETTSIGGGKLLVGIGQPITPEEESEALTSGKPARELRPALTAVQIGKGVIIRVGLPEWPQRLGDPSVGQVTRNIIDLLRDVEPRDPVHAMKDTAAFPDTVLVAGMVIAAALAAAAVLARTVRGRAWAMLGALVLTPVLLVAEIWHAPQIETLRDGGAPTVAAAAVGLALVGGLAWVFARRPGLFGLLVLAALPFRVPVQAGGSTANLLVPLYVVIGAGALAWLVPRLSARHAGEPAEKAGALEWVLLGGIVLYALQAVYAEESARALEQVVFFYVPFALMYALLRGLEWTPKRLAWGGGVLVVLALVFAAIGFWEFQTRSLLLNPKVIASNQVEEYFRVNSLFFDPNIYGRFLALVMIGLASVMVWTRRPRTLGWTIVALAILWGGLVTTLSQSSFAALLLGLTVLAWMRFGGKVVIVPVLVAAVAASVIVFAFPSALRLDLGDSRSLDAATSGRADLMRGGLELTRDKPVTGWGSGSFRDEYRAHEHASTREATSASHTIPITVSAEQGLIGFAAYLALLVLAFRRLLKGAWRSPARAAIAAGFAALVLHTWLYAAFLEDPLSWTLLAVGSALAAPVVRSERDEEDTISQNGHRREPVVVARTVP